MQICANPVQMAPDYTISIYLDTRRAKSSGLFPVKLRVYSPIYGKTKFYPTEFDLTLQDFKSTWETAKPRKENQALRLKLQALESLANEAAKGLATFSFEGLERKLFRQKGDSQDLLNHYREVVEKFRENNQFGTASTYSLSMKSLLEFEAFRTKRTPSKLLFVEVSKEWLAKYENYMVEDLNRSRTTVSMYLRALRAIYNQAIEAGVINSELYPFGEKKYQIPAVENVKKALSSVQLKILLESETSTPEQQKAKDFWFFSFICNGMNIKDIALLQWENFKGDTLVFYRAKTIKTSKKNLKPVIVYLNDFSLSIIEKYGVKSKNAKAYIFPIINESMTKEQQFMAFKNFTRFVNQNFSKYAKKAGITENISTYWARHSFATTAIRKGASMEFVSEALSHSNLRTTQTYFAGFEEGSKRELMNTLMDF